MPLLLTSPSNINYLKVPHGKKNKKKNRTKNKAKWKCWRKHKEESTWSKRLLVHTAIVKEIIKIIRHALILSCTASAVVASVVCASLSSATSSHWFKSTDFTTLPNVAEGWHTRANVQVSLTNRMFAATWTLAGRSFFLMTTTAEAAVLCRHRAGSPLVC